MKKILSLVIVIMMCISIFVFVGCGKENIPAQTTEKTNDTSSEENAVHSTEPGKDKADDKIPTTPMTTVIWENVNESEYRLQFVSGGEKCFPWRLFSSAKIWDGKNALNMDGVGVFPFDIAMYYDNVPLVKLEKGAKASIIFDDFTTVLSCKLYKKEDGRHEDPIKTFDDVSDIDFSDVEAGEYYVMFGIKRLGNSHTDDTGVFFTDSYYYECAVALNIVPQHLDDVSSKLTIEKIRALSGKGKELSWSDFEQYPHEDIGSGLYIFRYDVDENYYLSVGGGSLESSPEYILLVSKADDSVFVDIRTGDIDEFINKD